MSTDPSSSESKLQTAKAVLTAAGSVAATVVVARSIVNDLLPDEFHSYISSTVRSLFGWFSSEMTLIIEEFDGIESNHIYESANLYLGTKTKFNTKNTPRRLKISRPETDPAINITVDRGEPISDYYDGVWYTWTLVCSQIQNQKYFYNPRDMNSTLKSEVKSLEITFNKKHKEKTLNHFIPYVIEEAKKLKDEQKTIKLHTVSDESIWSGLNLNHPATFETIAMDPDEKKRIMEDLERFVRRKEYYKRVGKAWKRGYLLYGPPGTGKSSLIAAMANYLKFDVYDLELGALNSNSDLRSLLLATDNRSILVVEDIDCTVQLKNREDDSPPSTSENNRPEKKVTLSGFLNFIDGLWSSCGDERIIIFTTNYKDKLDPALLRPGRMDVHIHMSYCTPSGFKILASNYIGLESHDLFEEIIELIKRVQVTPAEVAEQLMKEDEPQSALEGLIVFLNAKSVENNEKKEEANKSLESVEVCSTMVVGV